MSRMRRVELPLLMTVTIPQRFIVLIAGQLPVNSGRSSRTTSADNRKQLSSDFLRESIVSQPIATTERQSRTNPPKVSLTFRVGVVGHRPNRLKREDLDHLGALIKTILVAVKEEVLQCFHDEAELYDGTEPQFVALSPLAEGVDRLFAEQALEVGYQLTAVLPFPEHEFERDFDPGKAMEEDSARHFVELLGKARSVFQLDGSRSAEPFAYKTAGNVVLNQSDLLIVVWDGERQSLHGGTEVTFAEAIKRRVPIAWIDAHTPHHWKLVTESVVQLEKMRPGQRTELTASSSTSDIKHIVAHAIRLPKPHHAVSPNLAHGNSLSEHPLESIRLYYKERQPRYNLAFWWKLFRDVAGDYSPKWPVFRVPPYETVAQPVSSTSDRRHVVAMMNRIKPFYQWADRLADRYADGYRSAFVMAFFFAAFSVAMALTPVALTPDVHIPAGHAEKSDSKDVPAIDAYPEDTQARDRRVTMIDPTAFSIAEFLSISAILFIVTRGVWGQWHRRWLDYRLLAEIIRHQQLVVHLGGWRASPSVPEHWDSYGNPGASWMGWYARALERSLGLPTVVVDRGYLAECLQDLHEQLGGPNGQIRFHEITSLRSSQIEHRLHNLEYGCLALTLACCIIHIGHASDFGFIHQIRGGLLTFFCGVFPAIGAALAGINHQAEFRRIAQRTHSMSKQLKRQLGKVESLQKKLQNPDTAAEQLSVDVVEVASETARIMVNEVLDWRVIFQDQPLQTT